MQQKADRKRVSVVYDKYLIKLKYYDEVFPSQGGTGLLLAANDVAKRM